MTTIKDSCNMDTEIMLSSKSSDERVFVIGGSLISMEAQSIHIHSTFLRCLKFSLALIRPAKGAPFVPHGTTL